MGWVGDGALDCCGDKGDGREASMKFRRLKIWSGLGKSPGTWWCDAVWGFQLSPNDC